MHSFIVDEEMANYKEIYKWMIGLGYPNSQKDFTDLVIKRSDYKTAKQLFDERKASKG